MSKPSFRPANAFLLALVIASCPGCAQPASKSASSRASKTASAMTVEDVVRLAQAGMSDEVILAQMRAKYPSFDLSADQLIQLKTAHVSDRVIRAMMEMPSTGSVSATSVEMAETRPAPQPAALAAAPAAPKTAASNGPVNWISHKDPMGFAINIPGDWNLRADRQAGRVDIRGPRGQQAVIWPMFMPRQQMDARSAASVAQQLARRADAGMAWEAPKLTGNTARVFARGATSGVAVMRWASSADGTSIYLFCVAAPASLYPGSIETFAGILQSFQVLSDPGLTAAPPAENVSPPQPVSWVRWTDPREGAFSASVPQGWNVTGGAFRQSASDIRQSLIVISPDHQIRMAVGDPNIGVFTEPNGMYGWAGMREGSSTSVGDGSRLQIRRFTPAQAFVRAYIASAVSRECGAPRILSENDRQDLAGSAAQQARGQGASNPRVTASGASFSCTWNGREARGYYAAATVLPLPGRSGIWYVSTLYGYIAVAERAQQADDISRHVLNSMGINAQWKMQEDQIAGNAVQQDNARSAEIQARARQAIAENQQKTSDTIVKGYEGRSKVYDEISRKRENAILGTVDVVDPSTGRQYKIDNYSDYHWMNNQGVIAGTRTGTSPGVDWHQMITLP